MLGSKTTGLFYDPESLDKYSDLPNDLVYVSPCDYKKFLDGDLGLQPKIESDGTITSQTINEVTAQRG